MESIKEILAIAGYDSIKDVPTDSYAEISVEGFDDLTIERISENRISIAHTRTQRGDLMREPEIVFKVTENDDWIAVEYQNDPGQYKHDEDGLKSTNSWAHNTWDNNLKNQGFIKAAREQDQIFK